MDRRRGEEEREAQAVRELADSEGGHVARKLLHAVPRASLEALLSSILSSSSPSPSPSVAAALLLSSVSSASLAPSSALTDSFLVGRTWTARAAKRTLLLALLAHELRWRQAGEEGGGGRGEGRRGREEGGPLVEATRVVGAVWGEAHFVQYGAKLQQEQVSWLLAGCLRHVGGRETLEGQQLVGVLVKAIQVRMESPIPQRREDAKRIAEMFAFRLDPTHKLKFDDDAETDEEEDEEVSPQNVNEDEGRRMEHGRSGGGDCKDGGERGGGEEKSGGVSEEANTNKSSSSSSSNKNNGKEQTGSNGKSKDTTRKGKKALWDDPDRVVLDSEGEGSEGEGEESGTESEEEERGGAPHTASDLSDSDSDDGLVPYEMDELEPDSTHATATATTATTTNKSKKKRDDDDDDEAMSGSKRIGEGRVPLPTRVRQCLAGLRSQSPDDVEAAMFAIEGVVLASQDLQGEECSDLARVLLRLEDRVAMEDFDGKRHAGLLALVCKDPKHVAPRLSQAVWDTNERLGAKLDALQVLSEAAFQLSALPTPPEEAPSVSSSDAKAKESVGKTRRWSRKSMIKRAEAKANDFGPLANLFFFSLLSGWDARAAPRLLGSDFILAGRVIAVLGCYVECSGNSPVTRVLAKSLMQLLMPKTTCLHSESYVRRCAQYSLSRVLAITSASLFAQDYHQEIPALQHWLQEAFQEDADEEVAKMAGANLYMLNEKASAAVPSALGSDWY